MCTWHMNVYNRTDAAGSNRCNAHQKSIDAECLFSLFLSLYSSCLSAYSYGRVDEEWMNFCGEKNRFCHFLKLLPHCNACFTNILFSLIEFWTDFFPSTHSLHISKDNPSSIRLSQRRDQIVFCFRLCIR